MIDYPALNEQDFLALLQDLLPRGLAWPREEGAELTALLSAYADVFAELHARSQELAAELDPARATKLLPEWERMVGLPDPCFDVVDTVEGRRLAVLGKLAARGGQDVPYYKSLCAAFGWTIEVEEPEAFLAGEGAAGDAIYEGEGEQFCAGESSAGDPLSRIDWAYIWKVHAEPLVATHFEAGESSAGDPLSFYDHPPLRCVIEFAKPGHTQVQYWWTVDADAPPPAE